MSTHKEHLPKSPSSLPPPPAPLRQKAEALAEEAQELGKITKDLASETVKYIRENAEDLYEQSLEKAKHLEKSLETKVRENPLQSLLIAGGIGLLVGYLFKRK